MHEVLSLLVIREDPCTEVFTNSVEKTGKFGEKREIISLVLEMAKDRKQVETETGCFQRTQGSKNPKLEIPLKLQLL